MNTIIEKIRAEIERRRLHFNKEAEKYQAINNGYSQNCYGARDALRDLEYFLSDLEKSENPSNPTIEKLRALIKMQIRREELNFASLGGGGQTFCINTLEWVLKQLDTLQEQPVCDGEEEEYEQIKQKVCSDCPSHKDDYCGYVKRQLQRKCNYLSDVMYGYELGRQSKPTTAEGLEEELVKYIGYPEENLDGKWKKKEVEDIARHFAKWGAEHLDK